MAESKPYSEVDPGFLSVPVSWSSGLGRPKANRLSVENINSRGVSTKHCVLCQLTGFKCFYEELQVSGFLVLQSRFLHSVLVNVNSILEFRIIVDALIGDLTKTSKQGTFLS